jgi:hypothetical protein
VKILLGDANWYFISSELLQIDQVETKFKHWNKTNIQETKQPNMAQLKKRAAHARERTWICLVFWMEGLLISDQVWCACSGGPTWEHLIWQFPMFFLKQYSLWSKNDCRWVSTTLYQVILNHLTTFLTGGSVYFFRVCLRKRYWSSLEIKEKFFTPYAYAIDPFMKKGGT